MEQRLGNPITALAPLELPSLLCHCREVASRGNDLPSHTGQRLSEECGNLWTRGDVRNTDLEVLRQIKSPADAGSGLAPSRMSYHHCSTPSSGSSSHLNVCDCFLSGLKPILTTWMPPDSCT